MSSAQDFVGDCHESDVSIINFDHILAKLSRVIEVRCIIIVICLFYELVCVSSSNFFSPQSI